MVSRILTALGACALLLFLSGCQTWFAGGTTYRPKDQAYTIAVPAGWHYATRLGPSLLATRDGLALQTVTVDAKPFDKALAHSKRTITAGMPPFELAETIADDLRADRNLSALEIVANEPARLGNIDGFKLTVTYHTADRLRLTETRYGVLHGGKLWTLRYTAPTRHYHARDLATFEDMASAFRFGT